VANENRSEISSGLLFNYEASSPNFENFNFVQEFKTLMAQSPELRMKLESAARNQQQAATIQKTVEVESENKTSTQITQPTIKLKTKFEFS
jgi:hypothetical protein